MIEHLDFFLYNNIFEIIILIPFLINILFINYFDNLQTKNNKLKKENTEKESIKNKKNNEIHKYKITIILIVSIIITIYMILKYKEIILIFLLIILPLYALINSIINTYNNKNDFSLDNKYINIISTSIYIIFFSSYVTPIHLESFVNLSHIYKEILLILYLIIKITLFTYLTSTSVFILISNINSYLRIKERKTISNYFIHKEKDFYFINYNFLLYRNYDTRLTKIIDIIIFTFLSIPTITINLMIIIFLYIFKTIKIKLFILFQQLENEKNWNMIIKKVTNISMIIAFIVVYIIMIIFKEHFYTQVFEIYTFLSTVILLPLIYDSIKTKN